MKTKRTAFAGIAILLGAWLTQGCGGSGRAAGSVGGACLAGSACESGLVCFSEICVQPAAAGAGGNAGSGGAGGAAATGGGAAGGSGGGTLGMACTTATTMAAPSGGLIADFASPDGGLEIAGGQFVYPTGATAPVTSTTGGALHIRESAAFASAAQYVGVGIFFGDCIDATAFTGVQFTISGSFSGCTMQYATGDVEHQDPTNDPYFATGPVGAYPPQTTLDPGEVTSAPQTLMIPFTSSTIFGSPQTPIDRTKLVVVFWQFTVPAGAPGIEDSGTPSCVADITIDNVTFY